MLVVVMLSYLLAATVQEVLGPGRWLLFLVIRSTGLSAYLVLAVLGRGQLTALLLCEALTMAGVLVLWLHAARARHPLAPRMVLAIAASGLAGIVFALSEGVTAGLRLDPASLSHLAQIPGMVLPFSALDAADRRRRRHEPRVFGAAPRRRPLGLDRVSH